MQESQTAYQSKGTHDTDMQASLQAQDETMLVSILLTFLRMPQQGAPTTGTM